MPPKKSDDGAESADSAATAESQPRKVRFLRTLGTIDCRKYGIDVGKPPQEGETRQLRGALAEVLLKRGLVTTA